MKLRDALTQMLGEFVASQKSPDVRLCTASNNQLNEAVKEERRNSIGLVSSRDCPRRPNGRRPRFISEGNAPSQDWNPLPLSDSSLINVLGDDEHVTTAGGQQHETEVVLRVRPRGQRRSERPSSLISRFRQRISPSRTDSIEEQDDEGKEEPPFDKKNSRESIRSEILHIPITAAENMPFRVVRVP